MYKQILVPLDGTEMAERALPHAQAQAERFQAGLDLIHVTEPPSSSLAGVSHVQGKLTDWAYEYLNRVAGRIGKHGLQVNVVISEGRAHEEIARYAETEPVDQIVLSSRGRSGLTRWMMGSVADRIVGGARVLVLRQSGAHPPATTRGSGQSGGMRESTIQRDRRVEHGLHAGRI